MNKVVITQRLRQSGMDRLEGKAECSIVNSTKAEEFLDELKTADGLMIKTASIRRKEIEACPTLRVIARHGVGFDTVDVQAATERGIPVVVTPGANARSVAEHTLAIILALTKNLVCSHNETVRGNWGVRQLFRSYEFEGKLVGFIGVGNIGREVAKMCMAIGFRVAAYDPFVPEEKMLEAGYVPYRTVDDIIQDADIISIHVPYNEKTKKMISMRELKLMKRDAVLVNCARGGIVSEPDLAEALKNGVLAGAGLDVFEGEELSADSPLIGAPNLICTPHMAAQTTKAVDGICKMMVEGTLAVLEGKKWPYVADINVYEHPLWKDKPWASVC